MSSYIACISAFIARILKAIDNYSSFGYHLNIIERTNTRCSINNITLTLSKISAFLNQSSTNLNGTKLTNIKNKNLPGVKMIIMGVLKALPLMEMKDLKYFILSYNQIFTNNNTYWQRTDERKQLLGNHQEEGIMRNEKKQKEYWTWRRNENNRTIE